MRQWRVVSEGDGILVDGRVTQALGSACALCNNTSSTLMLNRRSHKISAASIRCAYPRNYPMRGFSFACALHVPGMV